MRFKEKYEGKELEKLLGKSRTQVLRLAQKENWQIEKIKVGKIWKNFYLGKDIEAYLKPVEIEEKKEKALVRTVIKKEAKAIDELPEWNQRVARARYFLCMKLEEKYNTYAGSRCEIIKDFIKDAERDYPQNMEIVKKLSLATLRRWYGVYIKNKDNPLALSSGHGANKGIRRIDKDVIEDIKNLYLSKNKPSMMFVYSRIIQKYGSGAISYPTLRNFINKDMNIIEKDRGRMGSKEFKDARIPYVQRSYEDIRAGEWWMSDGHDLELMCYHKTKKTAKGTRYYGSPKLIVWIDVKSRFITGWTLSWSETTESIAIALKRGIEKYGIPENIFTDNGKAYTSLKLKGNEELDGIYSMLGVNVSHALPYNAQSKHIERWFVDFKNEFAKEFLTYKGGNVMERPERMKTFTMEKIAKGLVIEQAELENEIERFIRHKNHEYYVLRGGHRGKGMNKRTPLQVMNEELPVEQRRMLTEEKLRLLFLYEEIRTIQQNGINYLENTYVHEALYYHQGQKVKIKYDPHDLRSIYVYLDTGEFLCKAERLQLAGWNDIDAIKAKKNRLKKIRAYEKNIIAIREEDREESGLIEYSYSKREEGTKEIEKKKNKEVYIGNGISVVID